jgi:hypothetical protein
MPVLAKAVAARMLKHAVPHASRRNIFLNAEHIHHSPLDMNVAPAAALKRNIIIFQYSLTISVPLTNLE